VRQRLPFLRRFYILSAIICRDRFGTKIRNCHLNSNSVISAGTNDSTHPLAHPWAVASPATVGLGKDVMGGTSCKGPLCFSATCWYYGMELNEKLKVPIGLIHSSYGGSAVEDWISQPTLDNGKRKGILGYFLYETHFTKAGSGQT